MKILFNLDFDLNLRQKLNKETFNKIQRTTKFILFSLMN